MKPRLTSTRPARDLIKAHEPFVARAERRGRRWVVGYGHAAAAREGLEISREDAELLLVHDTLQADKAVERVVGGDLPAGARAALVSFACSVGLDAFKVSDVARLARAGRHEDAAVALESWVRIEREGEAVVSEALAERRAAEKASYLKGLAGDALTQTEDEALPAPGPLVELIIEFVDPPEALAAPEPEIAPALPPAEKAVQDAAPAMEPAPTPPVREDRPEPAPKAGPEPETADQAAAAGESQAEAVRRVMARMSAQIARGVREGVKPAAAPEPAVPEEKPADAPALEDAAPAIRPADAPKLGFSYLKAGEADRPLPPVPQRGAKAAPKPVKAKAARPSRPARKKAGGGRWFVTANLVIGLVLIAVGAWDVAVQADAYQAGILPWHGFGPVTFGIGVAWAALCVALMVRGRPPASGTA
jgi:lysozyme